MANNISGTGWKEKPLNGSPLEEKRFILRMAEAMNMRQEKLRRREHTRKVAHGFQAKTHAGIAYALFSINDELPEELQQGIFKPGKKYSAAIRFSGAAGRIQHDEIPSLHSVAIRVYCNSDGGEANKDFLASDSKEVIQDFLGTNAEVSHTRDAKDFLVFANADISRSRLIKFLRMFIKSPGLAFRALASLRKHIKRPVSSLATESYFGRLPFAMGQIAVKFRITPKIGESETRARRSGFNAFHDELEDRLRGGDVVFQFGIQRFENETTTPIEDATVPWPTDWETLAELHISQRDLATGEALRIQMAVAALEFNPWHSPAEGAFRPLGSLNRARRMVYDASADLRKGRRSQEVLHWFKQLISLGIVSPLLRLINRFFPWWKVAKLSNTFGLTNLSVVREHARRINLHDIPSDEGPEIRPKTRDIPDEDLRARTADGHNNDITDPKMGSAGNVFTRNIPVKQTLSDVARDMDPSPREISRQLMTRKEFLPIPHLNLFAVAWIQFQVHGWFNHERTNPMDACPEDIVDIPLMSDDNWPGRGQYENQNTMQIIRTPAYRGKHLGPSTMRTFVNTETSWWDASQIYGSNLKRQRQLRVKDNGYYGANLQVEEDGSLPEDPETRSDDEPRCGVDLTGFNDNYWVGLSLLHTLFAREHNAICDALADAYPELSDEQRFQITRLVVAALMAKIHTVEWTPAILDKPVMDLAFNTYWWGLAGQNVSNYMKGLASHEVLHGLAGSDTYHHTVPYAMTEEFVSVYRMHPLLPDQFSFTDLDGGPRKTRNLKAVTGEFTRPSLKDTGVENALYSFGLENPGAITLFNYPEALQNHRRIRRKGEEEQFIDVASLDIFRDRERGIPRYNDFRELMGLPRVKSFEELAQKHPKWMAPIKDAYQGNLNAVDAMVGMFAETPPHEGFGFSETAFRVFIVMAARRQLSDRFFTSHYRPDIYTELGLEWIERTTLKTMLLRHYPKLVSKLQPVDRIFAPWNKY